MKKILAVLLALAMVFSFAACGEEKKQADAPATVWPEGLKEVQIVVPNPVGAMLDQSTRIMVDYLNETYPDTNFVVVNEDAGGGNKAGLMVAAAPGDGSMIMAHGSGAIIQYYMGQWDLNLADTTQFTAICGNVGQLQPSGGVFLIRADEKRFSDIPTLVEYVKAHPGEVRFSYGTGTPHLVRMLLITEYYGITDMCKWVPGSTQEVNTWIQGGNTDVAILTETTACATARGGKAKAILDSLVDRNYTDDLKDIIDNCPIVTDYVTDRAVAETLVCAHPMTIFGPASMSDETARQINEACAGIAKRDDYMKRIKDLGSSNTYQIFSLEEIREITRVTDEQVKGMIEATQK
ncbi:MAG: tripartite tricarboxylate transporter substrate-binding protein [Bacillota bacterium]|nr:tripartite tricarboxylate transporter substrate-binding protein [Bacillota bacterium]